MDPDPQAGRADEVHGPRGVARVGDHDGDGEDRRDDGGQQQAAVGDVVGGGGGHRCFLLGRCPPILRVRADTALTTLVHPDLETIGTVTTL